MDGMSRLQDAVSILKKGRFFGQKREEEEGEACSYRIKQTKNRKTIAINCRECDFESSLNDPHCRENIFEILRKEIHADCLILSRLYERDYEGEALVLLYTPAGFNGIITSYRSTEMVSEACTRQEKEDCESERKEIIASFVETVENDPLRTRSEIRRFIHGKMLKKVPDDSPECVLCSACFYHNLQDLEKKLSSFPEVPAIKRAESQYSPSKMLKKPEMSEKRGWKIVWRKIRALIKGKVSGNLIKRKISGSFIRDTSGEVTLAEICEHIPFCAKKCRREYEEKSKGFTDEIFDYEGGIKPHVRPPFSSSRIYAEAPGNTEFLECYDISGREGRKLEVSIYRYTDRPEKLYMIRPPEYNLRQEELKLLEKVRRRMIRYRPKDLAFTDPIDARDYFRRMAKELLEKELMESKETCSPEELESYADLLARYTNGLGIVEDLLSDSRITDVYINAPADTNPVHVVMDGEECASNVFLSQDDLDALVSRFRTISGRPFGEAVPVLELNLEAFGVRVSVIGDPLSTSGLAYAFRKHSLSPWTLPKLINTRSISPFGAGLLSFLMDGQASVLVAGEVGAGKTSLLSAMLLEIPQKYRILTIEDTNEIPIEKLQSLGWKVQGMSSHSSVLKSGAEMSPETALRAALRLGNSSLVLGEVRGSEVKVLYEAMQVGKAGNSVIGTIHGSSIENVYERIVHTLGVPPASFKATDAVIICSSIRLEGTMRKLKRVSCIAEVSSASIENPEPSEVFTDIMNYDASQDCLFPGKVLEQGQSELIGKIANKWGISIDRALKNIELRTRIKEKIAVEGQKKPLLLEAEAVSQANNMFWLLSDSMAKRRISGEYELDSESGSEDDLEMLYRQWEIWFENFSSQIRE